MDPNASSSEQKNNLENQKSRNDFDDLVMKEKPDISWDQVIGLNDAKNAMLTLESRKNLFDTYTCKLNNDPKVNQPHQ